MSLLELELFIVIGWEILIYYKLKQQKGELT